MKKRAPRKPEKLWTWDIESVSWDQPVCVVATSSDGDVERFRGAHCLPDMLDVMQRSKGTWCAHFGGGYDVPLLLNHHRFQRIILSGSTILCAEDKSLKLRDTFPWWLASLAKVGKAVGLEKSPDVDRTAIDAMDLNEVVAYCENDCRVLLRGVVEARSFLESCGAEMAWTSGSSAVKLLKALEPGTWARMTKRACSIEHVRAAVSGVRGGRVECWARGVKKRVFSYDFKSSYPARYATRPVGLGCRVARAADLASVDAPGVYRCRWIWPWRDKIPPALDAVTAAGFGECENWLIDEEVEAFASVGVKVNKLYGFCPIEMHPVGQTFAAWLYKKKEGKDAAAFFAKVWLNSLHGKASEDPLKEAYTRARPDAWADVAEPEYLGVDESAGTGWWRWYEISEDHAGTARASCQPIAAAQILGRARVALWRVLWALNEAGWNVYYCDTDSVHTDCPPDKMPVPLGSNMGDLAIESGPCTAYYLGPKAYLLVDKHGVPEKHALKGVPLRSYSRAVLDGGVYRQARGAEGATDLRVDVFRDALSGGARCKKEGITSFLRGLRGSREVAGESWGYATTERVVRPTGRGKVYARRGVWYLDRAECAEVDQERDDVDGVVCDSDDVLHD